jgi:EAL and modified HD-GYP domain-containing signal transduction protein
LETIQITNGVVERCRELKSMGFSLALDDFVSLRSEHEALMPLLSIVKIEVPALPRTELFMTVARLKHWPVQLLAEKIDTLEQARHCKELGFDLFQGYYFSKPAIVSGKRADPSKHALLQLLSAVFNEAETGELEQIFKHDPGLTHSLLRLVNSVAMGLRHKIGSLKQALVVLGRRQLQRWLELLLFVQQGNAAFPSPLLILAATRGRLLELLAGLVASRAQHGVKDFEERAFLVGVMSLLDALLAMPMEDIVPQLNFDEDIKAALIKREGPLGNLLKLAELLERDDCPGINMLLPQLNGLRLGDLAKAQLDAMGWATSIATGAMAEQGNA